MDTTSKAMRSRTMDAYIASITSEDELRSIIRDAGIRRRQLFTKTLEAQISDVDNDIKLMDVSCRGIHDLLDVARCPGEMLDKSLTMILSVDDVIIKVRLHHRLDYMGNTEITLFPGRDNEKRLDKLPSDWFYVDTPMGGYIPEKVVQTFGDASNSIIKGLHKLDQCKRCFNMQT